MQIEGNVVSAHHIIFNDMSLYIRLWLSMAIVERMTKMMDAPDACMVFSVLEEYQHCMVSCVYVYAITKRTTMEYQYLLSR